MTKTESPSLNQLFDKKYPSETRDEVADVEDMWGTELTFNDTQPIQRGWRVRVIEVDVEGNTHKVELPGGTRRTISNDAGVYEDPF